MFFLIKVLVGTTSACFYIDSSYDSFFSANYRDFIFLRTSLSIAFAFFNSFFLKKLSFLVKSGLVLGLRKLLISRLQRGFDAAC